MKRLSLRWMMLVPTLVIITIGFIGFGLYVDRVEYRNRIADVDEELVRAAAVRAQAVEPVNGQADGGGPAGAADRPSETPEGVSSPLQLVVTAAGEVAAVGREANPFDQTTLAELARLDGFRSVANPHYRVLANPIDGGATGITGLSLSGVDESIADFRRALAVGGGVILTLLGVVVWSVTFVLVKPVARMSRTATLVAGGALDTQVGPPSGSRETAALAVDLDRMLGRLRSTLAATEQSAADARRSRDDMQRFLADVSHEIRTPLTALKGYSDLYRRGMLSDPGALDRAMRRVGDESERLHGLVSAMLELARGGSAPRRFEVVDVALIVADVATDLCSAHPERDIELNLETSKGCLILGSPGEIHQAVLNLGSNACSHTEGTSPIEIVLLTTDTDAIVRVIDHGPGIDPQDAERIFLPFFRVDESRTRGTGGGAGLGLAVTTQIADRHRGAVAVRTTPGGGATFELTIPRYVNPQSIG